MLNTYMYIYMRTDACVYIYIYKIYKEKLLVQEEHVFT